MKLFVIATALAATALAATPAFAGEGHRGRKLERVIARHDTDKDGRISRAEADAVGRRLAKHFDKVDANKDGYVTQTELVEGHRARKLEHAMARHDTDKDGRISRAEADAVGRRLARHFDQVDSNKDGYVTQAELVEAWKRRHEERKKEKTAK